MLTQDKKKIIIIIMMQQLGWVIIPYKGNNKYNSKVAESL